ncbi:MAG: hypothetical protein DMF87_05490 [Acidobacteria bacterium]|nr:MAG: hypothetical protein DMF88_18765 [Acidobacteriota bacterium]PYR81397.1 MAG: hypothetical protein DMF87_05490 [Acidobacteriota bacterium]
MPQLTEWGSFYVIVGSSAAALTGLMFVVITLVADLDAPRSSRAVAAFSTPTIVHFCVALVVSATLSAPWHGLGAAAGALGVYGVFGLGYTTAVLRLARRQTAYKPVMEDWLFHTVFPFGAYGAITVAASRLRGDVEHSLFIVAAAVLALVLIGIHNAWDTVTYLAVQQQEQQDTPKS